MKKCFDCGAELDPTAAFCSECGRKVGGKGRAPGNDEARQQRKARDEALKKQSDAEVRALRGRIIKAAEARNRVIRPFLIGLAGMAIVAAVAKGGVFHPLVGIPGVAAIFLYTMQSNGYRWLFSSEYYSITGSTDQDGQHRCIFCGHKGIFRQGQYRSNATYASCSKCKTSLFVE